jgi:hypothetical protein
MRRAEACAAGLVLVAGACAVLLSGPMAWANLLAAVFCLAAIGFGLWRAGWIGSRHRIVGLRWLADGGWLLADGRETAIRAELSGDTRLGRNILWLRWKTPRARWRAMLLVRGDLPDDALRALRVRLRIEAVERASPAVCRR